MLAKLSGYLYRNSNENCVMTTMVMSSAIKPSGNVISKQCKDRGNLQDNQDMQWVFLTTAKRRNSVEEQKLVRIDDKPVTIEEVENPSQCYNAYTQKHNATCLNTEDELKMKYSKKWLKHSRSNKSENSVPSGSKMKRNAFQSLRLPRRQLSINEHSSKTTAVVDNNVECNTHTLKKGGK